MEEEIWKDVVDWEEKYKVSNKGRVWNKLSDAEVAQVLTGEPQYKYVNLGIDGFRKLKRVHVLVAQAFLINPDPTNKKFVDHGDRDKMNNNADNLSWVTNSENQRNLHNSVKIGEVLLKDYVLKYDNPENAYSYIFRLINDGCDEFEAPEKYQEYLEKGLNRRKINWRGDEVYLNDLCIEFNRPYQQVSLRLSQGWDLWNAIYNVKPSHRNSFEIASEIGVYYWYKSNDVFETYHPNCMKLWTKLRGEGRSLEEILNYDGKDHLRHSVCGIKGTLEELCKHFGKTKSCVNTRMLKGMTLEDALISPPERIRKVTIDGVTGTPKYWYEHYGLVYSKVKRKKDALKCSFEDILKHFGVDISGKVISYID